MGLRGQCGGLFRRAVSAEDAWLAFVGMSDPGGVE